MFFTIKIIAWYQKNKRILPWRGSKDPYKVWLSEIILQQTRIVQGTDYYFKFIKKYPSIFDLAKASQQDILKLWQGLGYYSRARNLHDTAVFIVKNYKGIFPKTYQKLLSLKGIGDYTASAVGSICYNLPCAVVDGNVYRVLSRFFGIKTPINTPQGIKEFKILAQKNLDKKDSGTYNQAIMEFGALHCTPAKPKCISCPLQKKCVASKKNIVLQLPVKIRKIKIKKRYFNFLVFQNQSKNSFLEKCTHGIWKGLYQFPLLETPEIISEKQIKKYGLLNENSKIKLYNPKILIHKLTHQHLYIRFWIVENTSQKMQFLSKKQLFDLPVPVPIAKFIEEYFT